MKLRNKNSPLFIKGWQAQCDSQVFSGLDGVYKDKIPRNLKLKERAKDLRKAGYLHEVILWKRLKGKQMNGLLFHRQQIIGNFIVDFFAPSARIAIELDGSSHDCKIEYDKERDDFLRSLGINVIHIKVKDIFQDVESVVKTLEAHLNALIPRQPSAATPL